MSQVTQPIANSATGSSQYTKINTGQEKTQAPLPPLPSQLQNAHISPRPWTFKRIILAIFTFGASEKQHKNDVQVAPNPKPHLPIGKDKNVNRQDYLPQLSPNNDKLLTAALDAFDKKEPFPAPLNQAEQDAMNRLREVLGEENVPQGSTVYTLFNQDDIKSWRRSALGKKNFNPDNFGNTIYEHVLKFHAIRQAHTELAKIANEANPSFQPSATSIHRAINAFKKKHPAEWEQLLKNYTPENMCKYLSKQKPEWLYLLRLQDKLAEAEVNASERIYSSISTASGLPLDDVKQKIELTPFYDHLSGLNNSELHSQYLSEGFSIEDAQKNLSEQIEKNSNKAVETFLSKRKECYVKLNAMENLDKSVKETLARFMLNHPEIKNVKDIELCVNAILKTDVTRLIEYTKPDNINNFTDGQIMLQFDLVGTQIQNEFKEMADYYNAKMPAERNTLLEFVINGLSAKHPVLKENIQAMSRAYVENIEKKMLNIKAKYEEKTSKLPGKINNLEDNIREKKTVVDDLNNTILNIKAKYEEKTSKLSVKINNLKDNIIEKKAVVDDLNSTIQTLGNKNDIDSKELDDMNKNVQSLQTIKIKIDRYEHKLENLKDELKTSLEFDVTAKFGVNILSNINYNIETEYLQAYFPPEEGTRNIIKGLKPDVKERLDGIRAHGNDLFKQYGATLPEDKQAEFRLYLGTQYLGTAKDVPQKVLKSIIEKAEELKAKV